MTNSTPHTTPPLEAGDKVKVLDGEYLFDRCMTSDTAVVTKIHTPIVGDFMHAGQYQGLDLYFIDVRMDENSEVVTFEDDQLEKIV